MNVTWVCMVRSVLLAVGLVGVSVGLIGSRLVAQDGGEPTASSVRLGTVASQEQQNTTIRQLLELALENLELSSERFSELAKDEAVAGALIEIYHNHAIRVEPDCADLFEAKNGYVTATISMESFGKINSTGFDPTTNGARPITNRDVNDVDAQRIMRLIQSVLGAYHPEPIRSAKYPGLVFKFEGALDTGVGAAPPTSGSYICVIRRDRK